MSNPRLLNDQLLQRAAKGDKQAIDELQQIKNSDETGDACFVLGLCYRDGYAVKQDDYTALQYFIFAIGKGHKKAHLHLANLYLSGKRTERNTNKAIEHFFLAAKLKVVNATQELSYLADKGDLAALTCLAACYQHGYGTEQNSSLAQALYQKAINKKHAPAMCHLAEMLLIGNGIPQNIEASLDLFARAAQTNDNNPEGGLLAIKRLHELANLRSPYQFAFRNQLGACYFHGQSVPVDKDKAIQFITDAATAGNATAQVNLAKLYLSGRNLPKSIRRAVFWLRQALKQNSTNPFQSPMAFDILKMLRIHYPKDPDILFLLALCYQHGYAIAQDYTQAFDLFLKNTKFNHGPSFYYLGLAYQYGHGTNKNISEAANCYLNAAKNWQQETADDNQALQQLEQLANQDQFLPHTFSSYKLVLHNLAFCYEFCLGCHADCAFTQHKARQFYAKLMDVIYYALLENRIDLTNDIIKDLQDYFISLLNLNIAYLDDRMKMLVKKQQPGTCKSISELLTRLRDLRTARLAVYPLAAVQELMASPIVEAKFTAALIKRLKQLHEIIELRQIDKHTYLTKIHKQMQANNWRITIDKKFVKGTPSTISYMLYDFVDYTPTKADDFILLLIKKLTTTLQGAHPNRHPKTQEFYEETLSQLKGLLKASSSNEKSAAQIYQRIELPPLKALEEEDILQPEILWHVNKNTTGDTSMQLFNALQETPSVGPTSSPIMTTSFDCDDMPAGYRRIYPCLSKNDHVAATNIEKPAAALLPAAEKPITSLADSNHTKVVSAPQEKPATVKRPQQPIAINKSLLLFPAVPSTEPASIYPSVPLTDPIATTSKKQAKSVLI